LAETKSVICYVATRRLGYSGEVVAKVLGIARSGVCRGALRGGNLLLENIPLKEGVEELLN
jgi:putative transposase